jgi:hypothetical protein
MQHAATLSKQPAHSGQQMTGAPFPQTTNYPVGFTPMLKFLVLIGMACIAGMLIVPPTSHRHES